MKAAIKTLVAHRWTPLLAAALVSWMSLAGFWELAGDYATSEEVFLFDADVSAAIQSLRGEPLTQFVRAATVTGDTIVVVTVTLGIVAWLWRQRHDFALLAGTAVAGGALISAVLKDRFGRIRPPVDNALISLPTSFSFPSGHALVSLCLAMVGGYLVLRSRMSWPAKAAAAGVLALWVLLVGLSRIYLGVHWPSDVISSWLLGVAWLSAVIGVNETRRRRR